MMQKNWKLNTDICTMYCRLCPVHCILIQERHRPFLSSMMEYKVSVFWGFPTFSFLTSSLCAGCLLPITPFWLLPIQFFSLNLMSILECPGHAIWVKECLWDHSKRHQLSSNLYSIEDMALKQIITMHHVILIQFLYKQHTFRFIVFLLLDTRLDLFCNLPD